MKTQQSASRHQRIARRVESWFTKDYIEVLHNFPYSIWGSFVRGVTFGFGTVIGATVMVAFAVLVLHQFTNLPGVGKFIESLGEALQGAK